MRIIDNPNTIDQIKSPTMSIPIHVSIISRIGHAILHLLLFCGSSTAVALGVLLVSKNYGSSNEDGIIMLILGIILALIGLIIMLTNGYLFVDCFRSRTDDILIVQKDGEQLIIYPGSNRNYRMTYDLGDIRGAWINRYYSNNVLNCSVIGLSKTPGKSERGDTSPAIAIGYIHPSAQIHDDINRVLLMFIKEHYPLCQHSCPLNKTGESYEIQQTHEGVGLKEGVAA